MTDQTTSHKEGPDRRLLFAGLTVIGAAILVALVVALTGSETENAATGAPVADAAEVRTLLAGIPQDGFVLGRPDAPVTLVEYADLQCPFCARFAIATLPEIVERWVRPGRLRIEYRPLAFIGDDSIRAARVAAAAAAQDRAWHFTELLFHNQGGENSGYVDDGFLRTLLDAIPGLDATRALVSSERPAAQDAIDRATASAATDGVRSTPSFLIGRTADGRAGLKLLDVGNDADAFGDAIEKLQRG